MVDQQQTVCCMCGDVGFPEKLFRCNKCRYRFQHTYCSNYYSKEACDWCESEARQNVSSTSKKTASFISNAEPGGVSNRSEYAGDKIKLHQREEKNCDHNNKPNTTIKKNQIGGGTTTGGVSSPRTTTRRYKLLKDVMY